MSRTRTTGIIGFAAMSAVVLGALSGCAASSGTVSASSTAAGTSAQQLLTTAGSVPTPSAAPAAGVTSKLGSGTGPAASTHSGDVTWRSDGETTGAWLQLGWTGKTTIDHIRLDGAGGASGAYRSAVVTFSDGSSVFVTPDSAGNVSVDIASRKVTSARVRFASFADGATSVALHALAIDDSAQSGPAVGNPSASVSSSASGSTANDLDDGDLAKGEVGTAWKSAPGDKSPWAGFSWAHPVTLSSAQLAGITGSAAPMAGRLVFSDGSRIAVSGVASGANPLTTVAFTPRVVRWVRFDILKGAGGPLGEFRPIQVGTLPATWPAAKGISVSSPAAGTCSGTNRAVGAIQDSALALVCPASGSTVGASATVVVIAQAGATVTAVGWMPNGSGGSVQYLTSTKVGGTGRAVLTFSTSKLMHGPLAVKITSNRQTAVGISGPLYVQLVNQGGVKVSSPGYAPAGMDLQYADEFDSPLSVSRTGAGAQYGALKPEGGGGTEFGDAVFTDPSLGLDTLADLNSSDLRIRVQPIGSATDPGGYDRQYLGGMLSSMRVGGSGFSAQYGYYEARMLAPAGTGSWPAFWMLDSQSAVQSDLPYGEVDAVELYGHNPVGSCHSLHNWDTKSEGSGNGPRCLDDNGQGDWALSWHTYGVHIRPGGADYFIDGRQVATRSGLVNDQNPFYFMFDLSVGGGWPVKLDPTGGALELYVDWVRVYT